MIIATSILAEASNEEFDNGKKDDL